MRSLLAAVLIVVPIAALADDTGIQIDHAWSRAAMAGRQGVVYLTITDTGEPDTLTGVTTPVASKAELHRSIDDHGVMKMRSVAALPVAPGEPVTLAPGGYHIMLMGLNQPLKQGDSFPITLSFAKAGQVTVTATVQSVGTTTSMSHSTMSGSGSMPMQGGVKQP